EVFRAILTERLSRTPSSDEESQCLRQWQRDWLSFVVEHLSADWKVRYESLISDVGPPEHPEFPSYMTSSWIGPTSPRTADDLGSMAPDELARYLREWQPQGGFMDATREGLGIAFSRLVEATPATYADESLKLKGLSPIYLASHARGLSEALKNG